MYTDGSMPTHVSQACDKTISESRSFSHIRIHSLKTLIFSRAVLAGFAYTISATILYSRPLQSADTIPDQDRGLWALPILYRQIVDYIGKPAKFLNQE
jgi:hypothetical protein